MEKAFEELREMIGQIGDASYVDKAVLIYDEARNYHNCYPRFLKEYRNKNHLGCITCLEYQRSARVSVETAIQKLQQQLF